MCFLKKHWRFTILVAVVLCVLLLGVVTLYSTSETPEPKRVYAMPERSSPDNPPPINTGGLVPRSVPAVETDTNNNAGSTEIPSDVENVESCCLEESVDVSQFLGADSDTAESSSNMVRPSPEMIADAENHRIYWDSFNRYWAKHDALQIERKQLRKEFDSLIPTTADEILSLLAELTPEEKAELHAKIKDNQAKRSALAEKQKALRKEYPVRPENTHSH